MSDTAPEPEFSRTILVDRVGDRGRAEVWEASPGECAALAERYRIPAVRSLRAEASLRPWRGKGLKADLVIEAAVTLDCVVSLEPFDTTIREERTLTFLPEEMLAADTLESVDLDVMEADDPPEPITDGKIDLGEVIAQEVAVALPDFPRAPGVSLEAEAGAHVADGDAAGDLGPSKDKGDNPFAVLEKLKSGKTE